MSRSIGEYLVSRINTLKNWRNAVSIVAGVIKRVLPEAELYVFGSVVTDKITGASDIDLLVAIPSNFSEREIYIHLATKLEEQLGSASYIVDLHVVHKERLDKPPYTWWLKNSIKIK